MVKIGNWIKPKSQLRLWFWCRVVRSFRYPVVPTVVCWGPDHAERERQRGLLGSDWAPGPGRKQLESPDYSVDTYTHTHNSSNTTGFSDLPGWIVTTHCTVINHTHAHWGFLSLCLCNNHTHLYEHTRGRCFVSSGRRRGGVPGLWITLLAITGGAFLCVRVWSWCIYSSAVCAGPVGCITARWAWKPGVACQGISDHTPPPPPCLCRWRSLRLTSWCWLLTDTSGIWLSASSLTASSRSARTVFRLM